MRRLHTVALFLVLSLPNVFAQSLEALQDTFLNLKFGAFLHFNMGTFTNEEWAGPGQNPNTFNPASLDCGQWADAAVAAGMKYMTLTTKHHDGFCLWNSAYSTYDVGSSSWKGGSGDVVREFADSLRSRGLKVCFYYSIWDKTNGSDTVFIKNQLTELLTNYGPITALWFDGWGWQVGYTAVPYAAIRDHIKALQPECLVMENNHAHSLSNTEMVLYERNVDGIPPVTNTLPVEVCCNIRADGAWFYHESGNCDLRSVEYLYTSLTGINRGNGNYLLDLTPDRDGLIPRCQADRLVELKAYVPDTSVKNQDKAQYFGAWSLSSNRSFGDYMGDLEYTRATGDSFVFTFTGVGVDFITELNIEHGAFDLYLDGVFRENVDLTAPADTRPAQQAVFSALGLENGVHSLKGVYTSGADKYGVVDAFKVWPDTLTTPAEKRPSAQGVLYRGLIASPGGKVNLKSPGGSFILYSIHGRKAAEVRAGMEGSITIPNLPAGLYMIRSVGALSAFRAKVMILR